MAINLLGNLNNPFQQQKPQTGGMSVPKPQPAGTVGMSTPTGPKYVPIQQPMGVTAKNPASSAPTPSTTLPKTQQNPVSTPPVDTNYYMKPGESSSDYTARIAQYNASKNGGSTGSTNPPTPPATPPAQQTAPTFPGLLGQAVSTAQQGAPQASQYAQQAAQYGAGNIPIGQQAQDIGKYYQGQAESLLPTLNYAQGRASFGTTPVAEGNALNDMNAVTGRLSQLQASENAALAPYNQALTAQQQAATAAQAASGVPLSIYGTQLGALQGAATLAQPNLGAIGQVPYSPVDLSQGSPLGAPGGTAADAARVAGQFKGAQELAAAPYQGAAQGQQALAAAGGTGAAGVLQGLPSLQSANTAARGISNTIQTYLQQNPSLNANTATVANLAQQWIQGKQLGNPQYQTLFNYLSEYANTLAPVLGVGGDPTNMKTEIAQAFINAGASGQSISQVLDSMNSLADNKIRDIQSGATGGGTSVPAPNQNQNASLFSW